MTQPTSILDVLDSIEQALAAPVVEPLAARDGLITLLPRTLGPSPARPYDRIVDEPITEVAETLRMMVDPPPSREGVQVVKGKTGQVLADIPWLP